MDGYLKLDVPGNASRVLLHCCCAPCSSAIVECLLKNGVEPVIYYCNPNIFPHEEYLVRKNECERYASALGIKMVEAEYDHEKWSSCVKGLENEPERGGRCQECFKMRLLESAEYALKNGYELLTTTLASSRWKSLEQINAAGNWAVEKALSENGGGRLVWWDQNWRKGGLQPRRVELIKEYGFYNQLYCGCEYSMRK